MILRAFLSLPELTVQELHKKLSVPVKKIEPILKQLTNEGLLTQKDRQFMLTESIQQQKIYEVKI